MNDDDRTMRYPSQFIQRTFSSDQRIPSHDLMGASRYTVEFPENIKNVVGVELKDCYIPRSEYVIDSHNDSIDYEKIVWSIDGTYTSLGVNTIQLSHGDFTIHQLLDELNEHELIKNNIVFSIPNEKTNQILIELEQTTAMYNGFKFLFGTGPNVHRSAARVIGFESGVDSEISTRPTHFQGLMINSSNQLTTYNSNIRVGDIIEDNTSFDIGLVISESQISHNITLNVNQIENTYLSNILRINESYSLHIQLNKEFNLDLYDSSTYFPGVVFHDGNSLYLLSFANEIQNSCNILIKRNNEHFVIHDYSLHNINTHLAEVRNDMLLEIATKTRNKSVTHNSIKYQLNSNTFIEDSIDSSNIQFYNDFINNIVYMFFQPEFSKEEYTQYHISAEPNITYPDVNVHHNPSSPVWQDIHFNIQSENHIHEYTFDYKGVIKTNIQINIGDDDNSSFFHATFNSFYNSSYPNSFGLSFKSQSVAYPYNVNDVVAIVYNCPDFGDLKFNSDNSFYWSSSSTMAHSVFVGINSYAVIPYSNRILEVYVKHSESIDTDTNSFSILYPFSIFTQKGENGEYRINDYIGSSYLYIDFIGDFVMNISFDNDDDIDIPLELTSSPSSVIHFQSQSITFDTIHNSILLYVYQSPNTEPFTYYVINSENNVMNSGETSSNSFYVSMKDQKYGTYSILLNSNGDFGTGDRFTFHYVDNTFHITNHEYDNSNNTYLINSYYRPYGSQSIMIQNNEYNSKDLPISVITGFRNCNSPVINIQGQSFYFENSFTESISFETHNSNFHLNSNLFLSSRSHTFVINSNSLHKNVQKYSVGNSIQRISSPFTFTFSSNFGGELTTLVFQGLDENCNSIGNSITYTTYNSNVYYNSPFIVQSPLFISFDDITYNSGYNSYTSSIIMDAIKETKSFPIFVNINSSEFRITRQIYPIISYDDHELTYIDNVFFNSFTLFYKATNEPISNVEKNIAWKNIPLFTSNEPEISVSIQSSKIYSRSGNLTEYFSYYNHICALRYKKESNEVMKTVYIINKPSYSKLYQVVLDQYNTRDTSIRNFLLFKNKSILSPYKYDIQRTPIIQIVCERLGTLQLYSPIGFYNFENSVTTSNKLTIPYISKMSSIEISLKRRNSSLDKQNDENIYYEWNGMEHTLIVEFECQNTHSE